MKPVTQPVEDSRANWKVYFHTFLTHIRHDIQKSIDNQKYVWDNVVIKREGNRLSVYEQNANNLVPKGVFDLTVLGTESAHSQDNSIYKVLNQKVLSTKSKLSQTTILTNQKGNNTMDNQKVTNTVNEITSTLKTVGQQISESAITSAKMEAGENILLALRNIVMKKAGFMDKVRFKFAPVALDVAVTLGADVLVAELLPNSEKAELAVECLNLAMTKEIIHSLPISDFTNALTGGDALGKVKDLLQQTEK